MCNSCVKDLWAEWTWCIHSLVSATGDHQPGETHCRSIVLDCCWTDVCLLWSQTVCFLLYVNITQCRSDQTIFLIICTIACCIMSHFGRLEEFDRLFIYWHWFLFWEVTCLGCAWQCKSGCLPQCSWSQNIQTFAFTFCTNSAFRQSR